MRETIARRRRDELLRLRTRGGRGAIALLGLAGVARAAVVAAGARHVLVDAERVLVHARERRARLADLAVARLLEEAARACAILLHAAPVVVRAADEEAPLLGS